RGSLLLQRFAQLVEQARVLDRDDGLVGEVLDQLDLLVSERAHLLAIDTDATNQVVVLEHGNAQYGPKTGYFDARDDDRIAIDVALVQRYVGGMNRALCCNDLCKTRPWWGMKYRLTPAKLGKGGRRIV